MGLNINPCEEIANLVLRISLTVLMHIIFFRISTHKVWDTVISKRHIEISPFLTMDMPFCRDCGKEIQEEWTTCPFCSNSLENSSKTVSVKDSVIMGDVNSTVNDSKTISSAVRSASKCVSCNSTGVTQIACSSCKNMAHCNVCESEVSMLRRKERKCHTCAEKEILRLNALEKSEEQIREEEIRIGLIKFNESWPIIIFVAMPITLLMGILELTGIFVFCSFTCLGWGWFLLSLLIGVGGLSARLDHMEYLKSENELHDETNPKEVQSIKIGVGLPDETEPKEVQAVKSGVGISGETTPNKAQSVIIGVVLVCIILFAAIINSDWYTHDMEVEFVLETNCTEASIDRQIPTEYHDYQPGAKPVTDGHWSSKHTFDSSDIDDDDNYQNLRFEAYCSGRNANGAEPYVKITTILNNKIIATNSDSAPVHGASCDHVFRVYSNGIAEKVRADC